MKKVFLCMIAVSLLGIGALQAAPFGGPQCSAVTGATGNPLDTFVPFATWTGTAFTCEQQDKIYSNFTETGLPTDANMHFAVATIGAIDFHVVTVNAQFPTSFTISYDIAVDANLSPTEVINLVTGDFSNPTQTGTPSNLKQVFSIPGGALIGSITTTTGNPGGSIATNATSLHVVDTFTLNGGGVNSVSNTFQEFLPSGVPEPFTYALVGGGFLLLASLRRIRRS